MKPALLLIDLQQDYLDAPGIVPSAGQIIERASALLGGCRAAGIPIIHVWTTVSRSADDRMPHWKRAGRWQCVEDTAGHQPPAALAPRPSEHIVHKQFFSAFSSDALNEVLAKLGATTLLVAGVHLHACVRATVLDAYESGFEVLVAHEATASDDPVHAAITRRYLETRAARFLSVAELLELLAGQEPRVALAKAATESIAEVTSRARAAWVHWNVSEPTNRRHVLLRWAACLEKKSTVLAEQMAREIRKPIFYGRLEAERTPELVRCIAQNEPEPFAETAARFRRCTVGVIAVITPWNNPVLIPLGKIAAAVFYGNAVVWKPAPAAIGIAKFIMDLLRQAGCPENIVNLIEGDRDSAMALMSDAYVDAVTLTGGEAAGSAAQEICARRHIPFQAELGGNNAALVWNDADLELAAARIAEGAFGQAGQRCTANRRVIVHGDCCDHFLALLEKFTSALPCGDPLNPRTRVGPLISVPQRQRVAGFIARAAADGVRIILPHRSCNMDEESAFHPPTIVCCDDPKHEIVQEETFGPVLVVQRAENWEQAIQLCNGVRQGLVAALFTRSSELQQRFLNEAQAGVLKINQATADVAVHLPFGGWKSSGAGPPEHGIADREFYTRLQAVYLAPPA
jgi:acyl-CoA reductase-like NAD-dependent aldehyde dehydrogenase/nicotinamidase-related amidase